VSSVAVVVVADTGWQREQTTLVVPLFLGGDRDVADYGRIEIGGGERRVVEQFERNARL